MRKYHLRTSINLLLFFVLIIMTGCGGSLTANVYKGIKSTAITVGGAMQSAAQGHADGLISDKDMLEVLRLHSVYRKAHRSVSKALLTYKELQDEDSELKLKLADERLTEAMTEFLDFIALFIRNDPPA